MDSPISAVSTRHIARWDLDKTYLRTEFDTLRDLVKTAFERADEKRTNPGAATLLREMVRSGISVHILSGSPEQMRRRLEDKLRLDGIIWDSFTLKPNLQNVLRLRFRAVKDQLGYKLPALLQARLRARPATDSELLRETLFGDDAEADAFVYSLYADVVSGHVSPEALVEICERGRVYPDVTATILDCARHVDPSEAVERILIHLERQTPPDDFRIYGARAVPFYNYLQAAFVVHEDGRLPPDALLRVGVELVVQHRFDGDGLARSYLDLARRGHLRGTRIDDIAKAYEAWNDKLPAFQELGRMVTRLPDLAKTAKSSWRGDDQPLPDYVTLVNAHNKRRSG
ncbi:MAG: hypothetical protein JWM74_4901 [Myxococcaceae bacterium]|nr:hypothetical protein [Myxococcaceae bacterium]